MSTQDNVSVDEFAELVKLRLENFQMFWKCQMQHCLSPPEIWSWSFERFRSTDLKKFLLSVINRHEGLESDMRTLIQNGKTISAIKLCRERTGWDLQIAKRAQEFLRGAE